MRVGLNHSSSILNSFDKLFRPQDNASQTDDKIVFPDSKVHIANAKDEVADLSAYTYAFPLSSKLGVKEVGDIRDISYIAKETDNLKQFPEVAGEVKNPANAKQEEAAKAVVIAELEGIQREVIAHETAHQSAGGKFTGAASYGYTTGPDGKRYITSGEVSISVPATDDPKETLRNAEQVMKAALAPAKPSGQDMAVAAHAAQVAASARIEISAENAKELTDKQAEDVSEDKEKIDLPDLSLSLATEKKEIGVHPEVAKQAQDSYVFFANIGKNFAEGAQRFKAAA